jgi:putative FmdB family regulatory protein
MPLYDYRCVGCGRTFETLLNRWDAPAPPCPHCGAARAERQLSVFGVAVATGGEAKACGEPGGCAPAGCGCCNLN